MSKLLLLFLIITSFPVSAERNLNQIIDYLENEINSAPAYKMNEYVIQKTTVRFYRDGRIKIYKGMGFAPSGNKSLKNANINMKLKYQLNINDIKSFYTSRTSFKVPEHEEKNYNQYHLNLKCNQCISSYDTNDETTKKDEVAIIIGTPKTMAVYNNWNKLIQNYYSKTR